MTRFPKGLRLGLFLGCLAASVLAVSLREAPQAGFAIPRSAAAPPDAIPVAVRSNLKADVPAAHAATVARLPDRTLVAFWFAGSREGAGDVRIFGSRLESDRWSPPEPVISVERVMADEWRFVRKLGNPVAYVDSSGLLHLFFVSVSLGGWATSNLNQITSVDGGRQWGRARQLTTSPFANLSTLARSTPVPRLDGGFDLPIYHEGARKFPELLRFDATRSNHDFRKLRIGTAFGYLQPALVATGDRTALALLRDAGSERRLRASLTDDGGVTWTPPLATDQANPDSSVAVSRLSDGSLLLAYNPRTDGRTELSLAVSTDGRSWTKARVVELEAGGEFSYPSLLTDDDNDMHLVYTWQRKHIRHLRFNRAWLTAQEGGRQ